MNDQVTYYTDLISRYFAGEATPAEIQSLSEWIKEKDENRKLFTDYKKAWELADQSVLEQKIDLDEEWSALGARMSDTGALKNVKVISMASEGGNRGTRNIFWKVAATLIVVLVSAAALYYYYSRPQMIILTADAGTIEQVLPDSSVITLNKGATIEYPENFSGRTRLVKLNGEAYFNVAHDKTKPFIVSGENVRIKVLGTTFNVNTHTTNGNLSVVLASGKIALYFSDRSGDKLILLPGDKAEVSTKTHQIITTTNTDTNYLAWKTGHIVFNDTPLSDIIHTLNSVYNTHIVLSNVATGQCRVTATFDHQPVSSVLNVIKRTLDLQVSETGNTITISGKPCN